MQQFMDYSAVALRAMQLFLAGYQICQILHAHGLIKGLLFFLIFCTLIYYNGVNIYYFLIQGGTLLC